MPGLYHPTTNVSEVGDKYTHETEITELLKCRVHPFLHDEEFLFLFVYRSSEIAVLFVNSSKQIVDLELFGSKGVFQLGKLAVVLLHDR